MKYDSNTPLYSKDIARKPFFERDVQTRVMLYAPPPLPIKNGGGIKKSSSLKNNKSGLILHVNHLPVAETLKRITKGLIRLPVADDSHQLSNLIYLANEKIYHKFLAVAMISTLMVQVIEKVTNHFPAIHNNCRLVAFLIMYIANTMDPDQTVPLLSIITYSVTGF